MSQPLSALALAFGSVAEPPCDASRWCEERKRRVRVTCPYHARCAQQQEACGAFSRYVNSGRAVRKPWERPSAAIYTRLFAGRDEDSTGEKQIG